MANHKRNTVDAIYGKTNKELFGSVSGMASVGAGKVDRTTQEQIRTSLSTLAKSAADRVSKSQGALTRGEIAGNVPKTAGFRELDIDRDAKKKTPQWTKSSRIG